MKLKFEVAVCLELGDGGTVSVSADVTDKKLERAKRALKEDKSNANA